MTTDRCVQPTPYRPSKLRQDIYFAIQKNDIQLLVDTVKRIRSLGNKVNDPPFRQEGTGITPLCYAIQQQRDEVRFLYLTYHKVRYVISDQSRGTSRKVISDQFWLRVRYFA